MVPGYVDLRSDTVTLPTPEMRRAMAGAEVGDDAYGEDPTVNALEDEFAHIVGKPSALYVPSGTMGNQVALRVLATPGTSVLVGASQHLVLFESGAAGVNLQAQLHLLDDSGGTVSAEDVLLAREAGEHHQVRPGLLCVENTHMASGGVPWSTESLSAVADAARDIPVHMDGARLFNASAATGVSPFEYAARVTTVMSCLSKGLCAPVGSVLAGPGEVIEAARAERRRLGGGMRQAGVIAAAGLVGLRTMAARLHDDHARARRLAEAVSDRWPTAGCDPSRVLTNIVVFTHRRPDQVLGHLRAEGVLAGTIRPHGVRMVTHNDVDDGGIERSRKAIAAAP